MRRDGPGSGPRSGPGWPGFYGVQRPSSLIYRRTRSIKVCVERACTPTEGRPLAGPGWNESRAARWKAVHVFSLFQILSIAGLSVSRAPKVGPGTDAEAAPPRDEVSSA